MKNLIMTALATIAGLSIATLAAAQSGPRGGPPPVDEMAAALGIAPAQFETCMPDTPPAPGERPTREEMETMHTELFNCVHNFDSSITRAKFQQVMEQFRPEPPEGG